MSDESIASRIKRNKRSLNSNPNSKKKQKLSEELSDIQLSEDIRYESKITINDLNDDVMEEILSRLPFVDKIRSQTVCKLWEQLIVRLLSKQTSLGMRNIAYDRSDCSLDLRHSVAKEDTIDRAVLELSDDVLNYDEFDLRNVIQRNQSQVLRNLRAIFEKSPKILSLDLRSVELTDPLIELFDKHCPKLECLHLNSMVISDTIWQSLTNRLSKRLKHLTIRNSIQTNQKSFVENLIRNCNQLKCLKVTEWNSSLHFHWFDYICDSVDEIHIACTSAKKLFNYDNDIKSRDNIKRLKLYTFEALSQTVIDTIGDNFINLTQIDLRNCEGFNKRSYRPIAQLTQLRELTMDLPFTNCDQDFALLAQNCTQITKIELNFGFLTLNSLRIIGENWRHLESVSFRLVTIERLNSDALHVFNGWKRLRKLNLTGTNICDQICQVVESSPTLRSLTLDLCNYVSKTVVKTLISCAKRTPKQLFELSLKETRINKFSAFPNVNHVSDGVIKINNLYIYYTPEDI